MTASRPRSAPFSFKSLLPTVVFPAVLAAIVGCAGMEGDASRRNDAALGRYIDKVYRAPLDTKQYRSDLRGIQRDFGLRASGLDRHFPQRKEPTPLPGRIIVQIDKSQIANTFKPAGPRIDRAQLERAGLLPSRLEVGNVRYLGQARNGDALLLMALPKQYRHSDLVSAFRRSKAESFRIVSTYASRRGQDGITIVLVRFKSQSLGTDFFRFYGPTYPRLSASSNLHRTLQRLRVVEMRRVFRSVEKPDPKASGYYSVVPFKTLLELAKQQNPRRTGRAYTRVYSKDLDDILDAYRRHHGYAMPQVTDRGIIAAWPLIRSGLKIPVRVPDNMENYFVLTLAPGVDIQDAKRELLKHASVRNASFDYPFQTAATNDPYFPDQWGLVNTGLFNGQPGGTTGFDTKAETGWGVAAAQTPVVVAVVDTGIKEDLDELRGRLWTNPHEIAGSPIDLDGNGYVGDVHGITTGLYLEPSGSIELGLPSTWYGPHGTQVAGVIAAEANNNVGISGVAGADGVQLMNLAMGAFSDDGTPCGIAEFAQAVMYAIAPSTDPNYPLAGADIVNASFHGTGIKSWLPHDITMAALDAGVVIVASAGNEGMSFLDLPYLMPASLPGVITVGGSQRDGRRWSGSNHGYLLDLVAPAMDVATTTFDSAAPSAQAIITINPSMYGTSMSSAFVSGGAAVILGRFPDISGPYMNDWLRAKAFDMVDPLGDGTAHVGDDEWTGAGMLNIGNAATAALNSLDRPIDVEVVIKSAPSHLKELDAFDPGVPYAVTRFPQIGVRVQGQSNASWELAYALGEIPDQANWIPIGTGNGESQYETNSYGELTSGAITPLDTSSLTNGQLYSLRLRATNAAGTVFNAYSLFRPVRAAISFPAKNYVIVPQRGWLPLAGYIDLNAGQSYSVEVSGAGGASLWTSPAYQRPYMDYPETSGRFLLMSNRQSEVTFPHPYCGHFTNTYTANVPTFPANLSFLPEGPIQYVLNAGADSDSMRLYVDSSNFPISYWNILNDDARIQSIYGLTIADLSQFSTCFHSHGIRSDDQVVITPPGVSSSSRLFVWHIFGVSALDATGALRWQAVRDEIYYRIASNILVTSLDNTGPGQVIFAEGRRKYYGDASSWFMSILDSDTGTRIYADYLPDNVGASYIAAGNVRSGSGKDLILSDGNTITAMTRQGAILWTRSFGSHSGRPKMVDIDGDGLDEILLPGTGQILRPNNTFQPGWVTPGASGAMDVAWEGSTARIVVSDGTNVYLKALDGSTRPGWPKAGARFLVGKPGATGDDKIVIYSDRINTFNLDGTPAAGMPEITPSGTLADLRLHDVDGDGVKEFVVLMDRYKANPADNELVGNFLEAYEMVGGTRLADSDNRWPINIANTVGIDNYPAPRWDSHFAVGNVDGSGGPEVVQLLRIAPYKREYRPGQPGIRVELTHLP
ncbi:MAG: S8 family serine peptidase [Burkholderiales bacterium]